MRRKSWKTISGVLAAVMLVSSVSPIPVRAAEKDIYAESGDGGSISSGNVSGGDITESLEPLRIEVEDCTELNGAIIQGGGEESGQELGGVQPGGYAKYEAVDFGETGFSYAVFRAGAWGTGGDRQVEIRVDSKDGEVIGVCDVTGTGDWSNYENFGCGLFGNVTGVHDVYILFKGGSTLYNLNWFEFYKPVVNETAVQVTGATLGNALTGTPIQASVTPEGATVYYGWYVDGVLSGTKSSYTPTLRDAGKTVQLQAVGYGEYAGGVVSEVQTIVVNDYAELDFDAIAYEAFTSFINKYYTVKNGAGTLDANYFWDFAEMYEIVIDAYVRTGEERYKTMIDEIFLGFTGLFGQEWEWNDYNDDIMWMVIASVRAYEATGEQAYLDAAKTNFDEVYANYVDDALGIGTGMWWRKDKLSKNACVNGPAAIAACLLAEATGDAAYYEQAKACLDWVVNNLYTDGRIYDNLDVNGTKADWNFTYNQATFVGAATLLGAHYKDINDAEAAATYMNYAKQAVDYTIYTKYNAGVMNDETGSNTIEDCHGFKGILPRWFYLYALESNSPYVMDWMRLNGAIAWSNRNAEGIIWTGWGSPAEDKDYYSFGASTAVAMLQNIINSDDIVKEGLNGIEAEDFNTCKGIVLSEDRRRVSSVNEGYYTLYQNVDFGSTGAIRAIFNAGAAADGGTIEIRLDHADGELLGRATIGNTGSYSALKEVVCEMTETTGVHDICLLYKGTGKFLFELDNFRFSEEALAITEVETTSDSAYRRIEAEECDSKYGDDLGTERGNDEGGKTLDGINHSGYYAVYEGVEFGDNGADAVVFRASSYSGGTIEIRDGAVDGELLGTCEIPGKQDWDKYYIYTAQLDKRVTGTKDLYLVFKENDWMMILDWFLFAEADKTAVEAVQINQERIEIGTKLSPKLEPADATVNYEWYVGQGNAYALKGTRSTYTVTADDLGKTIRLRVTGTGSYTGCAESNETGAVQEEELAYADAYSKLEAEAFVEGAGFGLTGENTSDVGGGKHLGGVQAGGYAMYAVDFGEKAPVSAALRASSYNGGEIAVYLDEKDNADKLIGTFEIPAGMDWFAFQTYTCDIQGENITGQHTVYLVFNGELDMYNVNWFRFYDGADQKVTSATIPSEVSVGTLLQAAVVPSDATYSCKWFVDGAEAGTGKTYTVGFADAGKKIQAEITGTGLYSGTVTSNETNAVAAVETADAYETIHAESAISFTLRDDGSLLGNASNNSYALYAVDFGDKAPATIIVNAGVNRAGTVKVYLDEKDNEQQLIGTCQLPSGGWDDYKDHEGVITAEGISGKHFVYLVFTADGDNICNFDYFKFTEATEEKTEVTGVSIPEAVFVGDTLTAAVTPAAASVTCKWFVDGVEVGGGAAYTVQYADLGKRLQVKVEGNGNYIGTAESNLTNAVQIKSIDAYSRIEAESFVLGDLNKDGNELGGIQGTKYVMYANLDFGERYPASVTFSASGASVGGKIDIYLDGREDEKLVGTCEITPTGDWGNYQEFACALDAEGITGTHNVYLVFTALNNGVYDANGYVCNLMWLSFVQSEAPELTAPAITAQPADVTVQEGEKATIAVEASGDNIAYQWMIDRNDGNGWVAIEAATAATYTTPETSVEDSGFRYKCIVKNEAGEVSSNAATLTVDAVAVEPVSSYSVVVQKSGKGKAYADKSTAQAGETITLTAKADKGYVFKEWKVVEGEITLSNRKHKSVAFVMPAENVTVKAVFEKKSIVSNALEDLSNVWKTYRDEIIDFVHEVVKAFRDGWFW